MHQIPRPSPRSASAASNPVANPERMNSPREQPPARTRSSVDLASYTERGVADAASDRQRVGEPSNAGQDKEARKLNQIIQNFHSKAALLICSSRANLPQTNDRNGDLKQNRWFNVVVAETDLLTDDLYEWRRPDLASNRPSPLIVEVYIDTAQLSHGQALVVTDEAGRRWDISDTLSSSLGSDSPPTKNGGRLCEVVLERWTIALGGASGYGSAELNDSLANVYKRGVVLFRSLYTFLRLLPAWKLYRRLSRQPGSQQPLKLKFRIRQAANPSSFGSDNSPSPSDSLFAPLCPSQHARSPEENVGRHEFEPLASPLGPLSIVLEYRTSANFAAVDAESLLSSRFIGLDTQQTGRSLPGARTQRLSTPQSPFGSAVPSSRPPQRQPRALLGAYGSLSTFHAPEKRPSPVTELRQRALYNDSDDEEMNDQAIIKKNGSNERPRTSLDLIRNPPFKAGSIVSAASTSPRPQSSPQVAPSPSASNSSHNASSFASESLRLSGTPQRPAMAPPPRPTTSHRVLSPNTSVDLPRPSPKKYSSSFSDRKNRLAGGPSGSLRKHSISTPAGESSSGPDESRPGSGDLSRQPDLDSDLTDLQKYIKDLEQVTEKRRSTAGPDDMHKSTKSFTVDLGQYSKYREGNIALSQEISKGTGGTYRAPAATPPSRRLSNVPGLSISSSPSRPLPHMPAVRSRLSTHSVADAAAREGPESPGIEEENEDEEPFIFPMRD